MENCEKVKMSGYVSTSLDKKQALIFALKSDKPGKKPILQEIFWKSNYYFLRLNASDYSAYPQENEVLLRDGQYFAVLQVIPNYQVTDMNNQVREVTYI